MQCEIVPKAGAGPRFWINELKRGGESIPHIERESGMHGYDGELDYSDFDNLKEYALSGISPSSGNMIFRSSPIPVKIELDRKNKTAK